MKRNLVSIVSPVYNEEDNIIELCDRVTAVFKEMPEEFELILIENGSTDQSMDIIKSLHEKDPRIKYLCLSRNFGHQGGILAGLVHASGEAVVSIDGDLQQPPELIPSLVEEWKNGYEIVYTTKIIENNNKDWRYYPRRLFYKIISAISDLHLTYGQSDFRLLDRKAVNVLLEIPEKDIFLRGLVDWIGFSQTNINYQVAPRKGGESKFTLSNYITFALDGILSFSTIPLKFFLWIGTIIAVFCGIWAIYYFIMGVINLVFPEIKLLPPGSATITVAIFFLGGIQLIGIGILGEYIGRIFYQTKERPNFIVKDKRL